MLSTACKQMEKTTGNALTLFVYIYIVSDQVSPPIRSHIICLYWCFNTNKLNGIRFGIYRIFSTILYRIHAKTDWLLAPQLFHFGGAKR